MISVTDHQRIGLAIPTLKGGGAERILVILGRIFQERGYQVDYLLARAEGEFLEEIHPESRVIDLKAHRLRDTVQPLMRYFKAECPAAVQVSLWPMTFWAVVAHRLANSTSRLVLSDHNNLSLQYADRGALHKMFLRATLQFGYPRANALIAVSKGVARDLARISRLPVHAWQVIYNPIAAPDALPKVPTEIERLWGDPQAKRILAVGSFKPQKNLGLMIKAFSEVAKQRNARLMLLGDGSLRAEIVGTIAEHGLQDMVIMPGFSNEPWPYYASADLYAMSSDHEGFPMVLVEALHFGLPVVSTDCPSGPSEVLEPSFGRLVPCGDAAALAEAMCEMLDNPPDPSHSRQAAKKFHAGAIADEYLQLLLS